MNYIKIVSAIAVAASLVYSGWYVRGLQYDSVQLAIERVIQSVNEIKAQQIAAIKVENKTIYNKTVERIKTEVMYSECKQDAEMLHLTNYALTGKK